MDKELLFYIVYFVVIVLFYVWMTQPKSAKKLIECFEGKPLSDFREDQNKIITFSDNYDKVYIRLYNVVVNEPAVYRNDIIRIKDNTKLDGNSRVLEAGCGLGRHLEIIKEIAKGVVIEGVDKSQNMINQCRIRNPDAELLCTSLTVPEIYKKESLTHILALHDTLYHNTPKEISNILNNFHKWLIPNGYLVVHIIDHFKLDPAPRSYSQLFKAPDDTRHSLTYFEGFTHEAWWEKHKNKNYWYNYCEKYIFQDKKIKIHTTPLWIPPVNKMLEYITRHHFKLKEIIELNEIEVTHYNIFIFVKV